MAITLILTTQLNTIKIHANALVLTALCLFSFMPLLSVAAEVPQLALDKLDNMNIVQQITQLTAENATLKTEQKRLLERVEKQKAIIENNTVRITALRAEIAKLTGQTGQLVNTSTVSATNAQQSPAQAMH